MNNDLLIGAAFSKMKNNLRFMDKSVRKGSALLPAKVETSGDLQIYSGWRKGKTGRSPGEKKGKKRTGGVGTGQRRTWEDFLRPFSMLYGNLNVTTTSSKWW